MGRSQRRSSTTQQHGATRASNPHKPILAERFKTKMCEKYAADGACDYEARCMFAHGEHELRTKEQNIADDLVTEEAIKAFQKARVIAAKCAQKKRDRESGTGRSTATTMTPQRSSSAVSATSMASRSRRGSTVSTVAASDGCGNSTTRPSSAVPHPAGVVATTATGDGDGSFASAGATDRRAYAVPAGASLGGLPGIRRCPSPQTGLSVSFVDTPPVTAVRTPPWSLSFGACGVDLYALSPSPAMAPQVNNRHEEVPPLISFVVDPPPPDEDAVPTGRSPCASTTTPSHHTLLLQGSTNSSFPNGSFLPSARVSASTATLDDEFFLAASFTSERGCAALFKVQGLATAATPRKPHVTYDTTKFVSPLAAAMLSRRKVVSEECHCALCAAGGTDHDAEILLA